MAFIHPKKTDAHCDLTWDHDKYHAKCSRCKAIYAPNRPLHVGEILEIPYARFQCTGRPPDANKMENWT